MADQPISALPAASALTGADLAAVVQSGATKKATVDQVFQYLIDQAVAGETSIANSYSFMVKDGFGIAACISLSLHDDGFGGGGSLSAAHNVVTGGYIKAGDYLEVDGNVLIMSNPGGYIQWPNTGTGFNIGPDAGYNRIEFGGDFRFLDGISFGTYTATTGAITGSIAVTDKTGTTVHLMAFL